MRRAA